MYSMLADRPNPAIISASRRTDIPAFYGEWFRNRLKAGWCEVKNPFSSQRYRVSLARKGVVGWVFWSRNYTPFLKTLSSLHTEGQRFLCHFTINGLPRGLEPNTVSTEKAIETAIRISAEFGKTCLSWRYDPMLLTSATPPEWHLENFQSIVQSLSGHVERCYFSFPCMYAKTRRNLEVIARNHGLRIWSKEDGDFEDQDLLNLARQMVAIAKQHGVQLYSCCDTRWLNPEIPILQASCVDWPLLRSLLPENIKINIKHHATRKACGCYRSVDIGRYDTCVHGCAYCYAVGNPAKAIENLKQHSPDNPIL